MKKNKAEIIKLERKALEKLKMAYETGEGDPGLGHAYADKALIELLESLGFHEVGMAYRRVDRSI